MATFGKQNVRDILKSAGIETVPSEAIKEIVELHQEVQEQSVNKATNEFKVQESEDYKELKLKLDKAEEEKVKVAKELDDLKKQNPNNTDPKESEDYKNLENQFEEFKADIEKQKKVATISEIKKKALQELGLKGSALNLILKSDETNIEIDDKGQASEDAIKDFTKTISESHKDLIESIKGSAGASPAQNTAGKEGAKVGIGLQAALTEHYNKK